MPDTGVTVVGSITSAASFLGDVVFTWVPNVVTTIFNSVYQSADTAPSAANVLTHPLSAPEFTEFIQNTSAPGVYDSLAQSWYVFVLLSFVISLPFLAVVVYCWTRIYLLRRHEDRALEAMQRSVVAKDISKTRLRWGRILEQARGDTDHAWRLAILEADIMLNELLDVNGYKGETMADKMKQADRSNFNSIDAAWEAHKVRNRIAHEGEGHTLSQREVRRVIGLYEKVFKEFGFIE